MGCPRLGTHTLNARLCSVIGAEQTPYHSPGVEASKLVENRACEAPKDIEIVANRNCLSTFNRVRLRPCNFLKIPVPDSVPNFASVELIVKADQVCHQFQTIVVWKLARCVFCRLEEQPGLLDVNLIDSVVERP